MRYQILILPCVEDDIEDAYNWYEEKQNGLGELFLKDLIIYYVRIQKDPEIFNKVTAHFCQARSRRFPYVIIYEILTTEIYINSESASSSTCLKDKCAHLPAKHTLQTNRQAS